MNSKKFRDILRYIWTNWSENGSWVDVVKYVRCSTSYVAYTSFWRKPTTFSRKIKLIILTNNFAYFPRQNIGYFFLPIFKCDLRITNDIFRKLQIYKYYRFADVHLAIIVSLVFTETNTYRSFASGKSHEHWMPITALLFLMVFFTTVTFSSIKRRYEFDLNFSAFSCSTLKIKTFWIY